jgi:hypothetical protein
MCPRMVALRDLKLRGRELDDGTCAVSIGQVGVVGHDLPKLPLGMRNGVSNSGVIEQSGLDPAARPRDGRHAWRDLADGLGIR